MSRFGSSLLFHTGVSVLELMHILKQNFLTQRRNDAKARGFHPDSFPCDLAAWRSGFEKLTLNSQP
jgi:hypothetical protein